MRKHGGKACGSAFRHQRHRAVGIKVISPNIGTCRRCFFRDIHRSNNRFRRRRTILQNTAYFGEVCCCRCAYRRIQSGIATRIDTAYPGHQLRKLGAYKAFLLTDYRIAAVDTHEVFRPSAVFRLIYVNVQPVAARIEGRCALDIDIHTVLNLHSEVQIAISGNIAVVEVTNLSKVVGARRGPSIFSYLVEAYRSRFIRPSAFRYTAAFKVPAIPNMAPNFRRVHIGINGNVLRLITKDIRCIHVNVVILRGCRHQLCSKGVAQRLRPTRREYQGSKGVYAFFKTRIVFSRINNFAAFVKYL